MEKWVPLMEIFMNSPCPEAEASQWLQHSFNSTPNSSHPTISTTSFLSLLIKTQQAILVDSSCPSPSSPPHAKSVMWIQTLPDAIHARILSFLVYERQRFCKKDLCKLARSVLSDGQRLDFWVKKAAQQLLHLVSDSSYEWVSCLNLDSEEDKVEDQFYSVPDWLKNIASDNDAVLSWLPLSSNQLNLRMPFIGMGDDAELLNEIEETKEESVDTTMMEADAGHNEIEPIGSEVEKMAACLKARILSFESTSKTVELANEIRQLCVKEGRDSLAVMRLIEPWEADDETALILLSHISNGTGGEFGWPSHVLCSIVLPKFLVLNESASRILVTATVDYCKVHQRAAESALLLPLILRVDGINNPICDVVTRIIKESLHPGHVSSFCQKILCEKEDTWKFSLLPCHQSLINNELVWTESLFSLMQNILNHNVLLTQDSIDQLVHRVCGSTHRFSKSLKFGNFLLCLVNRCASMLKSHKLLLTEAVEHTNTLVTKPILSKLASL